MGGGVGSASGKPKLRYMFVFDKVLLTCKSAKGDCYSYKDSLKMSDYRLQDLQADHQSAQSSVNSADERNSSTSRWVAIDNGS